jgi:hypothetical protein
LELAVDAEQALGEGETDRGRDGTETDCVKPVLPFLDNSIACGYRPRVDP